MKRPTWLASATSLTLWCLLYIMVSPQPVHAYVDPGNGLLLLQAAGSIIVSVAFMARSKIRSLISRVGKVFRRDSTPPAEPDPPGEDA